MSMFIFSTILPWLCGGLMMRLLLGRGTHSHTALTIGAGYLLGLGLMYVLMQTFRIAGMAPDQLATLVFLIVIAACCSWQIWGKAPLPASPNPAIKPLTKPEWIVALIVVIAIAMRYSLIFDQIILRPLFPWDAWMNWAPKAIVWFELDRYAEFMRPADWLLQPQPPLAYTLGNAAASPYPELVPMIQLWGMLAIGESDSSLPYVHWLLAHLAMTLSLFGALRIAGASLIASSLACYALASIPILTVHSALAGYADIWLSFATFLAAVATYLWHSQRSTGYLALAIAFAWICTQLKLPGRIHGLIIVGILLGYSRLIPERLKWGILALSALFLAWIMLIGIDLTLPGSARLVLSSEEIRVPGIGYYLVEYHNVMPYLLDTFLLSDNWNLLFWCLAILLTTSLPVALYHRTAPALDSVFLAILIAYLLLVFSFTRMYMAAENYATVNRAFLYIVPLACFVIGRRLDGLITPGRHPAAAPPKESSVES